MRFETLSNFHKNYFVAETFYHRAIHDLRIETARILRNAWKLSQHHHIYIEKFANNGDNCPPASVA
jgi:hypothetical protein